MTYYKGFTSDKFTTPNLIMADCGLSAKKYKNDEGYIYGKRFHEEQHNEYQKKLLSIKNDPYGILAKDTKYLDENGYLIIENLLSLVETNNIENEIIHSLSSISESKGSNKTRKYCFINKSKERIYDKTILNERINNIMRYYLFGNYLVNSSLIFGVEPGAGLQGFHRDSSPFMFAKAESGYNRHPLMLTVHWAITDFTKDNGSTVIIPGSHLWNPSRKVNFKKDKIIKCTMPRGSALIWFDSCVHAAGNNLSNKPRRSVIVLYSQPWIRSQENVFLNNDIKNMPNELQKLLGYSLSIGIGVVRDKNGQAMHPQQYILSKM